MSAYDRSILALKLKPMIQEQQKQKQIEGGKEKVQQKSVEATTTQKELGKIAGVSHDTIHKVEVIQKEAPEEAERRKDIQENERQHPTQLRTRQSCCGTRAHELQGIHFIKGRVSAAVPSS